MSRILQYVLKHVIAGYFKMYFKIQCAMNLYFIFCSFITYI